MRRLLPGLDSAATALASRAAAVVAAGAAVPAGVDWSTNFWGDAMYEHLNFRDVVAAQSGPLQSEGFTERQARFLATVMAHSGVFVERQYCRFAGVAHGQKSQDFVRRLVAAGFAREERPGRLIGIHPIEDRYLFTYLVTRASTADFRTFLVRHHHLWRMLNRWTLRVLIPKPLVTSMQA